MRKAFVLALICAAAAASACHKQEEQQGLVNWENAPPLLAGVDEGANSGANAGSAPAGAPNGGNSQGLGNQGGGAQPAVAQRPPAAPGTTPVRKAGLWQISNNDGRGETRTSQLCVTDETELRRGPLSGGGGGRGGPGCDPKIAKGANGSWTSTMSCTRSFGDNTLKTSQNETLTGDLSKSYKITGRSTTSGSPREEMNGTRNISISGVYKGACPAGMKGGDMIGSDGQRRNVFENNGRGPGGPGGGFGGPGGPRGGGDGQGRRGPPAGA